MPIHNTKVVDNGRFYHTSGFALWVSDIENPKIYYKYIHIPDPVITMYPNEKILSLWKWPDVEILIKDNPIVYKYVNIVHDPDPENTIPDWDYVDIRYEFNEPLIIQKNEIHRITNLKRIILRR